MFWVDHCGCYLLYWLTAGTYAACSCRLHKCCRAASVCHCPLYGHVPVARPPLAYFSVALGCLYWRHAVYAPVRAHVVVEVHSLCDCLPGLAHALEALPAKQLVLYCAVDPFRDGVVLRVAPFSHAYANPMLLQEIRVGEACVLQPAVGVVDQAGKVLALITPQGHLQGFKRVAGLQALPYAVADDLAAVAVCHKREEAEAGASVKRQVGDVAGYKAAWA